MNISNNIALLIALLGIKSNAARNYENIDFKFYHLLLFNARLHVVTNVTNNILARGYLHLLEYFKSQICHLIY